MNNLKNLIGLSFRAKKLIIGTDNILKNLDKAKLILVSIDLSNDSLNKIKSKSDVNTPLFIINEANLLSDSLGLNNIKAVSIIDEGFKELILKSLN